MNSTPDEQPLNQCRKCGQIHNPRKCTGHVDNPETGELRPCKREPTHGLKVCNSHGARAPQSKRAAARRLEVAAIEQTANAYGIPRHIDPADGLIEEYWRTAGIVAGLEAKVRSIPEDELIWGVTETTELPASSDEDGTHRSPAKVTKSKAVPNIWLKLFNEERDRFAKLGVEIVRLGLEARRDEYVRAQVDTFAAIVFHPQLALTETQRATAAQLLRDLDARQQLIEGVVER